ncbi:hypothetical protein PQ469_25100 [Mucilaginibacter sp. KACC 22773]|uniref:hypothetical protein n=1 Tax=Mucilaginibacter sp. KACC 22773 TaxID=3025671 RepID=UPI002365F20E|nr:hypothetical protein [Mucilaginibacter sp. KACC 22773]WDF77167.1 hypothetical protein PQ469_25100 [Mucilaginibacter sp. KACC 22773]
MDYLTAGVIVKPAIEMFYIYFNQKIALTFRKTRKTPQHTGIRIAAKREYRASLRITLPAITDFTFDEGETFDTAWLLLSDGHNDFESAAIQLCELVSCQDIRIGKVTPSSVAIWQHSA